MLGLQSANFKCKHNWKWSSQHKTKNNHHPIKRRDFQSACSMLFGIKRPVDFSFLTWNLIHTCGYKSFDKSSPQSFLLALHKLCKETGNRPLKVLFFFPEEKKTGIAPTRLISEKHLVLSEGQEVSVNWQGKKIWAEIIALNGK